MPENTIHVGDLYVDSDCAHEFQHITEVRGELMIGGERVRLPNLRKVDGHFYAYEKAELSALEEITGAARFHEPCFVPLLHTIGGKLYCAADITLAALMRVGGKLDLSSQVLMPKLRWVAGHEVADEELRERRIRNVATAALATADSLYMSKWHSCDTTHCIAGWGIHLAGEEGYELEKTLGPETAGAILLGPEATAHFFVGQNAGRDWLKSKLEA